MQSLTILVTGSNKGIGFEIVRQLAALGHRVILSSRSVEKGIAAVNQLKDEGLIVHFQPLDITDELSINGALQSIQRNHTSLDVLINNAGILLKEDKSLIHNSSETLDQTLFTNARAQLEVTRRMLPIMNDSGRIIMISSGGGSMTDSVGGWSPAYCVSKSLLNAMTRHLAHELAPRITVNACCPGWVKTDMGGRSAPRTVQQGADTAVWLATAKHDKSGKFFRNRKEIPW